MECHGAHLSTASEISPCSAFLTPTTTLHTRGSVEPANYKRSVLPLTFLGDLDEYHSVGAFMVPEIATWDYIMAHAHRRAYQQRDCSPGGQEAPGRTRLRGLHRSVHRPTLCKHADPVHVLVPLEEPGRLGRHAWTKDGILFIHGRSLGTPIPDSRKQKALSEESEPFEELFPEFTTKLKEQMAEARQLQDAIERNLDGVSKS